MNATVTIQIGNSDDKLTQKQWANFVNEVRSLIVQTGETHFDGGSRNDARWQNFCWVVAVPLDHLEKLKLDRNVQNIFTLKVFKM